MSGTRFAVNPSTSPEGKKLEPPATETAQFPVQSCVGLGLKTICCEASKKGTRVHEGETACVYLLVPGVFELSSRFVSASFSGTKIV